MFSLFYFEKNKRRLMRSSCYPSVALPRKHVPAATSTHRAIKRTQECCLLGCGVVWIYYQQMFRKNVASIFSVGEIMTVRKIVDGRQLARRYIPEGVILHSHRRENLKS
jgi:hypothetical protein